MRLGIRPKPANLTAALGSLPDLVARAGLQYIDLYADEPKDVAPGNEVALRSLVDAVGALNKMSKQLLLGGLRVRPELFSELVGVLAAGKGTMFAFHIKTESTAGAPKWARQRHTVQLDPQYLDAGPYSRTWHDAVLQREDVVARFPRVLTGTYKIVATFSSQARA